MEAELHVRLVGRVEDPGRILVELELAAGPAEVVRLSVELAGQRLREVLGAEGMRVETAVRVIENATSLGGTVSKLEGRHRWECDRCPPGLLRLSVGLEEPDELWADLEQALALV